MNDLELDALAFRWRGALDTAATASGRSSAVDEYFTSPQPSFGPGPRSVERERCLTDVDLERLARATHTHLHRHMQGPRATGTLLGLGSSVEACVFDLDGVLTPSTALHAAAWRETFDEFLSRHHARAGEHYGSWRPFEVRDDYLRYIHGRPRIDGARGFLASRGIRLPAGTPDDLPSAETEWGLAARKNEVLQRQLRQHGVSAYEGSIRFLELAREAQLGLAIVSASANTLEILERAGLLLLVDQVVDGNVMREERLRAEACARLGAGCLPTARRAPCGGCDVRHDGRGNRGRPKRRSRPSGRRQPGPLVSLPTADVVVSELADLIAPEIL